MKPTLITCELLKSLSQADSLRSALLTALLLAPLAAIPAAFADRGNRNSDWNLYLEQPNQKSLLINTFSYEGKRVSGDVR